MINLQPKLIFEEYQKGVNFKNSLGEKGLYEQYDINERFYVGDQWYGARCGNSRPLVRHNIIKRIGEFKLSQILDTDYSVEYSAEGIAKSYLGQKNNNLKKKMLGFKYTGNPASDEINAVNEALTKYRKTTVKRLGFDNLCAKAIKNAYISGTGIIYTYWDSDVSTGIVRNSSAIKGDIKCEVLNVKNVYFANPYDESVENQPYIIIASVRDYDDVIAEAQKYGADEFTINNITAFRNNKVLVLTKIYKQKCENGSTTVMCVKVTENATIRSAFDTKLRRYPIAVFRWEDNKSLIYGDSEITHLIPNQIAINRMITANVWSSVTMGMPMMVVNGDTVSEEITNEPGQIIKIYGSNEDVAGAVKYITPPNVNQNFGDCVNSIIENTLAQCGANQVALGDSKAENMSALNLMRNAAILPLQLIKCKYLQFISDISLIWADFWITQYKNRKIKIYDENGIWYLPFNGERYKDLYFVCNTEFLKDTQTKEETIDLLTSLFEKGIINKKQFLERLPKGIISDVETLLLNEENNKEESS